MTTHTPLPSHMATMPRRPLTARPVGQRRPHHDEPAADAPWRVRWDWSIRHSGLHPNSRLVALMAATWTDPVTGVIPPVNSPGVPALAAATGLYEGTVRRALQELTRNGFMTRIAAPGGNSVRIVLRIPDGQAR